MPTTLNYEPIKLCANCAHLLPGWYCDCREYADKQAIDCPDWQAREGKV